MMTISTASDLPTDQPLHIYGAGEAGRSAAAQIGRDRIAGFIDSFREGVQDGVPVFLARRLLPTLPPDAPIVIASMYGADIERWLTIMGFTNLFDAYPLAEQGMWQDFPGGAAAALAYRRRERFILADLVGEAAAGTPVSVLDAGARDAFRDPRWSAFGRDRIRFYGFEPDEAECAALTTTARREGYDCRYFPVGLWRADATVPFYVNHSPGGSSFFPQNRAFTDRWRFQGVLPDGRVVKEPAQTTFFETATVPMATVTADAWAAREGVEDIDFFKLNVQGAELAIFQGASALLPGMLGVQVEISFVESYVGRPFFSDIDVFLRGQGFMFFSIIGLNCLGRSASPISTKEVVSLSDLPGQAMEGHALYLRDPIESARCGGGGIGDAKLLKLIAIAEVYGQVEYAFELLDWRAGLEIAQGRPERGAFWRGLFDEGVRRYRQMFPQRRPCA